MTEFLKWALTDSWGIGFTTTVASGIVLTIISRVPKVQRNVTPHVKAFLRAVPTLRVSTARYRAELQEVARQQGREEVEARVAAERAKPTIRPAWAVKRHSKQLPTAHLLINYEVDAVATSVRLSAPVDRFGFDSVARWDEVEHMLNKGWREAHFQGSLKGEGMKSGVTFLITYLDENGDTQTDEAFLDAKPPEPARVSTAVNHRIPRRPGG